MTDKEYEDALKKFHKATKRHILVVETNIPQDKARQIFAHADRLRKAGNELVAIMRNRYTQLRRTKRNLTDGTRVQRDWYSSFLLYCCDRHTLNIDKFRCRHEFAECLEKERALIAWIKANKIKVLNSGIKIAA